MNTGRPLDKVLVVDVESTCWERVPPPGETSDIIEIGVCLVDVKTLERSAKRSLLVKPARSNVGEFCTRLTTITPEMVAGASPLAEACAVLESEYLSRERVWFSHGDYDRKQFEENCRALGVRYPFGPTHVNAKALFALLRGMRRAPGMAETLKILGLPHEGTHHRGDDDAWNIAAIVAWILARGR